jgi:TPR repeat protein
MSEFSVIDSAKAKLASHQFPIVDLPRTSGSALWKEIRSECGLTLSEVSALQNYVFAEDNSSLGLAPANVSKVTKARNKGSTSPSSPLDGDKLCPQTKADGGLPPFSCVNETSTTVPEPVSMPPMPTSSVEDVVSGMDPPTLHAETSPTVTSTVLEEGTSLLTPEDSENMPPVSTNTVDVATTSITEDYGVAQLRLGHAHRKEERYREAYCCFQEAAKLNLAEGQYMVGECFAHGEGVDTDLEEAAKWKKLAAYNGCARAQCEYAFLFRNGFGVKQSDEEGIVWLRKAAKQGYGPAMQTLGECYIKGEGVKADKTQAVKWLSAAAAHDTCRDAQRQLGQMFAAGDGVSQDFAEAYKWLQKAAELGCQIAQYEVGNAYFKGIGVEKSYAQAVRWYHLAAKQKYIHAFVALGDIYAIGLGVVQNRAEAANWYRKAAEKKNSLAMGKLATCYLNGFGVPKSQEDAMKYYYGAAALGDAASQRKLKSLLPGTS